MATKEINEARQRASKLKSQIEDLRFRYHVLDDPKVSDSVYESLIRELQGLEETYPQLRDLTSPVNRIAGQALDKFRKVRHDVRMTSLNDVFSTQELKDWEKRIKKLLPSSVQLEYFCELKLDGLAVSLVYEKGVFIRGATRGDGFVGEDITQNLKTIQAIPLQLRGEFVPDFVEVRGEAVMSKAVLEALNNQYKKMGKPLLANTRNATAGSLRQLDPALAAERRLDFFAYDIAQLVQAPKSKQQITKHAEEHERLREFGFKVDKHEAVCKNVDQICEFIERIQKLRPDFKYGTDGVVVSVNDLRFHDILGIVGKAPRYMVAYKYPAEKATTKVTQISVNVGRTGVLTPVAFFSPTLVAGSMVAKATLHNMDQIDRLGLKIGDTVVIQKAGDVIPEVVEVLPKLRTGKEKPFGMPAACPICNFRVEKRIVGDKGKSSAAYYCSNPTCPAKNQRSMEHFVNAFEIYTIGPKVLARLKDEGLISDAADLFTLQESDLAGLERFGTKSAENIVGSIKAHRTISLARFIFSLGIPNVGEQTSEDLATYFNSLEKIKNVSLEQLKAQENIGDVVASSIYDYFRSKVNMKFVDKLLKNGVVVESFKPATQNHKLAGKVFVLTGTLESMGRDDAKKKIKSLGGKVSSSVSKATDFVVAGSNPGSKMTEAQKLGVSVITEEEFKNLLTGK